MAWLFMPILRSGLRTFNESAEERGDRKKFHIGRRSMRGKDEVRQTDIDWTFFHRPVTLRGKIGWTGVEREGRERSRKGKFRKPLAAKRIFLPVLVESSWKKKKKNFPSKVFRRLVRAYSVALHVKRLWKERQSPFRTGIKEYLDSRSFFEFVRASPNEMCHVFRYESRAYIEIFGKIQSYGTWHPQTKFAINSHI